MKIETIKELFDKTHEFNLHEKLVAQIQKDFFLANIELFIPESISANALQSLIQEKLYVLLLEKFDDYLNVLYVIDIPEKSLKEINTADVVEVSKEVTFLVLKREFQKVWFKSQYA